MSLSSTTNMAGNVGAAAATATTVDFSAAGAVPPSGFPKEITVSIIGTGNARVAINTITGNAVTDSIITGGGTPAVLAAPEGIKNVLIYADNGETLTYQIIKNLIHMH